jgi:hypothetical protein
VDDAELDAAIRAISAPERLRGAQALVARIAPSLQAVLGSALSEGGWFDSAHNAAVREASELADPGERLRAVRLLCEEETRLSMLVGVAVGVELARELGLGEDPGRFDAAPGPAGTPDQTDPED